MQRNVGKEVKETIKMAGREDEGMEMQEATTASSSMRQGDK